MLPRREAAHTLGANDATSELLGAGDESIAAHLRDPCHQRLAATPAHISTTAAAISRRSRSSRSGMVWAKNRFRFSSPTSTWTPSAATNLDAGP